MSRPVLIDTLRTALLALGPVRTAFLASIALSLVAMIGLTAPNNDGILYVETALAFKQDGLDAARRLFDWLTMPILIAALSSITGLEAQAAGHVLSTLLLAGCCALLVACTRELFPHAAWPALAIALALPALNAYRDYIVREFGAWFFMLLAIWWVLRSAHRNRLLPLLAAQASICLAALFRPEYLIFLLALPLFELFRPHRASRRVWTASTALILGLAGLLALWVMEGLAPGSRLATQLTALDPARIAADLREGADVLARSVLNRHSADEAGSILFFGLLSILPMKYFGSLGVFVLPAAYAWRAESPSVLWQRWRLFAWCFLLYTLVLLVFLFNTFFLTSRYVALLVILTAPLAAVGLHGLMRRSPAWRYACLVVIALLALSNVVSTSPPKTSYVDGARWIGERALPAGRIYFEERTVSYLAGLGYKRRPNAEIRGRSRAAQAAREGRIDYLVLSERADQGPRTLEWASTRGLVLEAEFIDRRDHAIRIFRRADVPPRRAR